MSKIRVLIVDDHAILRDCIRILLSPHHDIEVVGEACGGRESIEKARECSPDVILMDIVMPGMDGLEATQRIRKQHHEAKVVALTQYEDKEYVLAAFKAGVAGYVPKRALSSELVAAIRAVQKGDTFLYPSAAKALIGGYIQRVGDEPYDRLTGRERQILKLAAGGHTSREIGNMFQISPKTVQGHRMRMMKKLGLHNLGELFRYAARKGLLNTDT